MRLNACGFVATGLMIAGSMGLNRASAEIVETSPGLLACDTSAGRYERTDIGRFFSDERISGRFRFIAGTDDRTRAPVAGYIIRFHNGEALEVHVMADPRYPRKLDVEIGLPGSGSQPVVRVSRNEPVEVTASISNGVLTVASAGRSKEIPIGARQVTGVEASCQSGRFEIDLRAPVSG